MDVLLSVPIGGKVALDSALSAITFVVERHESLRTYYPHHPSTHEPRQILLDAGEFDVQVIYCAQEEYEQERERTSARLLQEPFDLSRGPLFRTAIIVARGRPQYLVLAMSHMVTDGWGTRLLEDDLAKLLGGAPHSSFAPANWHPQDQAAWEASDVGQRLEQRSLDFWGSQFSSFPRSSFYFPPPKVPASPRYSGAQMQSEVLRLASEVLAAKYGTSQASIIGAAVACCISYICGVDFSAINLFVANRYSSNSSKSVGNFFQEGLLFMPLSTGARFVDVAIAFHTHALTTYGFTRFAPQKAAQLAASIDADAGTCTFFREIVFNMISGRNAVDPVGAGTEDKTPLAIAAAPPGVISQRFLSKRNEPRLQKIYMEYRGPSYLFVYADSAYLNYSDTSELLRTVEALLLDATISTGDLWPVLRRSALPKFTRGPEWMQLSNSWVNLLETQRVVEETLSGLISTVFVGGSPGDHHLELYVAEGDLLFDPARFRDEFMRRMQSVSSIYLPNRYKVFFEAPLDRSSKAVWEVLPVARGGVIA